MNEENLFKIPTKLLFWVKSTISYSFKLILTDFISTETESYTSLA